MNVTHVVNVTQVEHDVYDLIVVLIFNQVHVEVGTFFTDQIVQLLYDEISIECPDVSTVSVLQLR